MNIRRLLCFLCLMLLFAALAPAYGDEVASASATEETVVTEDTPATDAGAADANSAPVQLPDWVDKAIELGQKEDVEPYPIRRFILKLGTFTTPFLRVAIASSNARNHLREFDRTMITASMLKPTLEVRVFPLFGSKVDDVHRSAEHAVIRKPKSKDPKDAVQPLSKAYYSETESAALEVKATKEGWKLANGSLSKSASPPLGTKVTKKGLFATFPIEAFESGNAFLFLYEKAPLTDSSLDAKITDKMVSKTMP